MVRTIERSVECFVGWDMRGLCAQGAFADISFFHFFSPLRFSFHSPAQIHLPCPQQPFEAVLPFLKQITEFLEKLLTWPRSKFSYGSFNLELLCILHLFFFNLQYMPKFFSLTPSALCPLARSSSQSLPACGKAIADCSQSFPAPM